ncbi:MAG: hypothetical protein U9R34_03130 [Nanoarchaeota archaeon]|nr:hypothetical protein [Nanoarchaeota archaeon]
MNAGTIQEKNWNDNLWIKDESTGFSVVEREREIVIPKEAFEKVAEKLLTKEIQSKIVALEKQILELKSNDELINVSNSAAEELLRDAIKQFKEKGITGIDIIDLHLKTKLPINQIGEIMERLEVEGVVTEDGETKDC